MTVPSVQPLLPSSLHSHQHSSYPFFTHMLVLGLVPWGHRSLPYPTAQQDVLQAIKPTPPCLTQCQGVGHPICYPHQVKDSFVAGSGTTLCPTSRPGGKVPDEVGYTTITRSLCKLGKVHGLQDKQGQAGAGGSLGTRAQEILPLPAWAPQ